MRKKKSHCDCLLVMCKGSAKQYFSGRKQINAPYFEVMDEHLRDGCAYNGEYDEGGEAVQGKSSV